jgi:acyl-[acyl-carrier-protein]-phospholipid O-acyltransferase/long-chain-fatty-acid--[acyl-carrier-protein] ligase
MFLKLARQFARLFYRVTVHGSEKLPAGGFLLLPNHVTWVDAIVLQIAFPRPIRFMIWEPIYRKPLLNPLFRLLGGIPITNRRAKEAVRHAAELIRGGEVVCIFPEGELTRSGILLRLKRGYELIAHEAGAPVVPVWLDQLWGSIFSYQGNRYFKKIPRRIPYPVTVAFGDPISPEKADIATVRQMLLELGEFCFQQRPILRGHLGEASLRGLKHKQFDVAITDGIDGRQITHGMLLAVSIALSRHIRKNCANKRIGVVLPTSIGAVASNLAVMLAGKVPVNLNFTAGRAALESAIRIAGLDTAISAKAFMKRAPDFPFPKNILLVEELIPQMKTSIAFWRAMVVVLPWWVMTRILGVPRTGDREEAVVLFTSGSSGEPKGVVLSHRNLLGNVSQFSSMLNLDRHDSILASLPYFHSFGCTVTLWYPLIEGVQLVTNPNPIDVPKNAELIERHKITMLLSTPTFLRGYIKRADRKQLDSLKLIATGAEKLPNEIVTAFFEKFGKQVEQGYGLTETSPVVSVNLPEPPKFKPDDNVQPSSRLGSAGKLAPGIAAQIRDPETGALLTLHDTGMLWLRGVNIFEGYLNDPKRTAEVLVDGWFKTGDLGRFDEDGFLYIEGRLSRFSKIGGEMVPHETLESKIYAVMQIPSEGERAVAVVGVPDEAKGEALVLLSVPELSVQELRAKLLESGVPPLWIPKSIRRVEKIPVLGSGKLDLKQCKELAVG